MAGINVLLDSLKGGNKLEKTTTPKGKDVIDSPDDAAGVFAAMLSGSMNLNASPKGQNSSVAGQDMGGTQSVGNFALPFLTQVMLQSDFPAGKEANSGSVVSQGTENSSTAISSLINAPVVTGNNFAMAMLKLVSLASDEVSTLKGMSAQKPQGDNPGIAELDKYRQVISDLLVALSGEITDPSLKGDATSLKGAKTIDLSQNMAKIVQGWMTVADKEPKNANLNTLSGNVTSGQVQAKGEEGARVLQGGNEARANSSSTQIIDGLEALIREIRESTATSPKVNPLSSESSGPVDTHQDVAKPVQGDIIRTQAPSQDADKSVQGDKALELFSGLSKEIAALASKEDTVSLGSNGIKALNEDVLKAVQDRKMLTSDLKGSKSLLGPTLQGRSDSTVKESSEQPQAVNDVQNQNSSIAIGVASNTVVANVVSGKTVAIPVWEQISTGFREQILNRNQELKELDIQLHPAELGKVQINLRWENGLVHLQVQASEATTGQILQHQLSDLRHTLTDQGVNCGTLQMGQGGDQRQNHRGDDPQKMFNQSSNSNADEELTLGIKPVLGGQDEINRINVTA